MWKMNWQDPILFKIIFILNYEIIPMIICNEKTDKADLTEIWGLINYYVWAMQTKFLLTVIYW